VASGKKRFCSLKPAADPVRKPLLLILLRYCPLWLSFLFTDSIGQSRQLTGIVTDKGSLQPVVSASIRNINTGKTALSRMQGQFGLPGSKGDILAFSATGFYTDTLTLTDSVLSLEKILIGLRPLLSTLPNVTVSANYSAYQLDSIARRKEFLSSIGEARIPTVGRTNELGFGVALNLDRFSKREKRKRHARDLFDLTEEEAYINYRWNDTLVYKYTKFAGDKLSDFMLQYRPEWVWLRKHPSEEDLLYYINRSLKKFNRADAE
jgi:hypothetical protein